MQAFNEAGTRVALMMDAPAGQARNSLVSIIGPLVPSADSTATPFVPPTASFHLETGATPVKDGAGDVQLHWAPAVPGARPRLVCISAMSRGQTSWAARQTWLAAVGCEVLYLPWPGVPSVNWSPDAQALCGVGGEQLRIYDWGSDLELAVPLPFTSEPAALLAWSPASDCVLHVHCGLARLVQRDTGRVSSRQQLWQPHLQEAAGLAWSSAGTVALFSISDVQSGIALYCLAPDSTLQQVRWVDTSRFVTHLSWSSSCGQLLAWAEHGHRPAPYFSAQSAVRVVHGPSGRVAVIAELPFSMFALRPAGKVTVLPSPCSPELSIDLHWQPDSSLIVVGPEHRTAPMGLLRERPVRHFAFGVPSRTWAACGKVSVVQMYHNNTFQTLGTYELLLCALYYYLHNPDWRWSAAYLALVVLIQMSPIRRFAADLWCWAVASIRVF